MNSLRWVALFALMWILLFTLFGCTSTPITKASIHPTSVVTVYWSETPIPGQPKAGGVFKRAGSLCTITTKKPRDMGDTSRIYALGHEMFHCTDGLWHGTTPIGL